MGAYFSEELFHFVGHTDPSDHEKNYSTLKSILQSGCISHPPHNTDWGATSITFTWDNALVSGMIVPTVVCFCDIPREHLSLHINKYGAFGLSLPKGLLARYGGRPVMYVPIRADNHRSPFGAEMLRDVEQVYRGFRLHILGKVDHGDRVTRMLGTLPASEQEAASAMDSVFTKHFLAFLKPYDLHLAEDHLEHYYAEREWRKFGNQQFSPSDVRRIIVAPGYKQRLGRELPQYERRIEEEGSSLQE